MRTPRMYAIVFFGTLLAVNLSAVTVGHVDTFEDGTTMGWIVGNPLPFTPLNIATGGPGGSGDNFLQLTATGQEGPGGRLAVMNSTSSWSGSYLGISAIRMDVRNFGPSDVNLRLLFEDFAGIGPPVNAALSTNAVFLAAGSDWTSVVFSIAPGSLTPILGTVEGALANTDTLRLFHNPLPQFFGPPNAIPNVNVILGVDNIAAVPEPGSIVLIAAGLSALTLLRRRSG